MTNRKSSDKQKSQSDPGKKNTPPWGTRLLSNLATNSIHPTGDVNEKTKVIIEAWPSDSRSKRLFQRYWFVKEVDVGPSIWSVSRIVEVEAVQRQIGNGRIQIGDCLNGDEIFLRLADFAVLYRSHEVPLKSEDTPENGFHLVYDRVEFLLIAICNRGFVPSFCSSGKEYYELFKP